MVARLLTLALLILVVGCAQAPKNEQEAAMLAQARSNPDDLLVVDCALPPQVRQLGGAMTYLSQRRPVKTTAVDCRVRGGEYVAYDRANYASALKTWLPKAKGGNPEAQTYVGEIYERGQGTAPDPAAAAFWYRKAADQGYSRAMTNLGYLYEKGLGVERDVAVALNWYRRASGLTDDDLQYSSTVAATTAALEQQIGQLESERTALQQELGAAQRRLDAQKRDYQRLRGRLASTSRALTQAQLSNPTEAKRLKQEMASLEGRLVDQQVRMADLRAEIKLQQSVLTSSETEREEALADSVAMRSELDDLRVQLAQARQDAEATQSELASEQAKISSAKSELVRRGAFNLAYKSEVEQIKQRLAEKEGALRERNEQVAKLEQAAVEQEKERARLQREVSLRDEKNSSLESELAQTQTRLTSTESQLSQQSQQLIQEQEALSAAFAELDRQRAKRALSSDAIDARERDLRAQQQALEQRTSELARLEQEAAQFRQERRKLTTALVGRDRELSGLRERLAASEQRLAKTELQASKERELREQQSSALAQALAQKELEATGSASELAKAELALAQRERELKAKQETIAQLERKAEAAEEALEEAQPVQIADAGPSIEILDPPMVLTRGRPTIQLRSAVRERRIVGKVAAPAGLLTFNVNDRTTQPDSNGVFDITVPVGRSDTLVEVVAIDATGRRAELEFMLVPRKSTTPVSTAITAAPERPTKAQVGSINFGNYYALVIGNNDYEVLPKLRSAANDARDVERVLRTRYGFTTTLLIDATRYDILSAMNGLREKLSKDDNLLIYYAGHGELDRVNDRGYWLPIDAEYDNSANWISNISVTDMLNAMAAKHILVIADSCYSGAMSRAGVPRMDVAMANSVREKWMKVMSRTKSRVVLTSGGLKPVLDVGKGGHSIFANAFLEALNANSGVLEGYGLYRQVNNRVRAAARRYNMTQEPEYAPIRHAGHAAGEFFFVPRG